MNGEQIDFRKLVESLERQRAAIEQMIAGAKAFLGEAVLQSGGNNSSQIEADEFVGKTIVEGTTIFLRKVGRPPRTTDQIAEALNNGGLEAKPDSVAALLMRDANAGGEIYKVGRGLWGLAEWYPGAPKRTKKKGAGNGDTEKNEGTEKGEPEATGENLKDKEELPDAAR